MKIKEVKDSISSVCMNLDWKWFGNRRDGLRSINYTASQNCIVLAVCRYVLLCFDFRFTININRNRLIFFLIEWFGSFINCRKFTSFYLSLDPFYLFYCYQIYENGDNYKKLKLNSILRCFKACELGNAIRLKHWAQPFKSNNKHRKWIIRRTKQEINTT